MTMAAFTLWLVTIALGQSLGAVSGAVMSFLTSTNEIIPNLTSNLNMTCDVSALTGTTVSSGGLVGRDTSNLIDSIKYLTSLVVIRNKGKEIVASITEHTPASAKTDNANMKVKGHITGSEGSLQLSWSYPTNSQVGDYICEINGLTSDGHSVSITKNLAVTKATPNMSILVENIGDLKRQNDQRLHENDRQRQDILRLQQRIANLEHVESGIINCGSAGESDSKTWYGRIATNKTLHGLDGTDMYLPKTVRFSKAYGRAPVVHLSTAFVWMDEEDQIYYNVDLVSVSSDGFNMRCRTYDAELYRINGWTVSWVSIPQ